MALKSGTRGFITRDRNLKIRQYSQRMWGIYGGIMVYRPDPRINWDLAQRLKGANILIAGAGRGIGRAAAELFSHCGPRSLSVVALEQDEVDETAKLCQSIDSGIKIRTGALSVTDVQSIQRFVEDSKKEFASIDVLVMNAGRPPQWLPTAEGDPHIWWETVAVSLQGAYNFSRYVLPIMQKQNSGGRIIFTSSAGAHTIAGITSYILGKLGMVRLAEIIHAENVKEHNIKAFAIHPGAIPTRFFHDFKSKVEGKTQDLKYIKEGAEGEEKSAQIAKGFFKDVVWDTPYLAAGMMTMLASGQLDFMSGRYVDSGMRVEELLDKKEVIAKDDLDGCG